MQDCTVQHVLSGEHVLGFGLLSSTSSTPQIVSMHIQVGHGKFICHNLPVAPAGTLQRAKITRSVNISFS